MDERPYLSIGDVLSLLQREFPDVTISKIRFLESRGLLVPDRTPSGYRKFYEHDVERLRWILRQQREHFLPLKVIKGRLEGQEPFQPPALFEMGDEAPVSAAGHGGQNGLERPSGASVLASVSSRAMANGAVSEASRQGAGSPATSAGGSGASSGAIRSEQPRVSSRGESARPAQSEPCSGADYPSPVASGGKAQPRRDAESPGDAESPSDARSPRDAGSTRDAEARREASRHDESGTAAQLGGAPQRERGSGAPGAAASRQAQPARTSGSGGASKRSDESEERAARSDLPAEDAPPAPLPSSPSSAPLGQEVAALVGVSLTAAELAQASGLEVEQVRDLESYGLIEGKTVAGVRCFDESALVVARLAAGFARFGVEARHLRVFKYAAERQTGLYSQIVLPLLRQRNPNARRQALEDVAQLGELGTSLQACFAKAALRDLTGG